MNKVVLLAIAAGLGAGASQALAADLPVKAPPLAPVVAPVTWTNCYVGGHAGYGWSRWQDRSLPGAVATSANPIADPGDPIVFGYDGHFRTGGFVGGGQFGCDKQFGQVVLGAVIDISWTDQKKDSGPFQITPTTPTTTGPEVASVDLRYFGTARARLGYLFAPNWLFYGTGGLAVGKVNFEQTNLYPTFFPASSNDTFSNSTVKVGWAAGAGVEYGWSRNWTLRAEYLHVDLGSINATSTTTGYLTLAALVTHTHQTTFTADLLRAALNYRF